MRSMKIMAVLLAGAAAAFGQFSGFKPPQTPLLARRHREILQR